MKVGRRGGVLSALILFFSSAVYAENHCAVPKAVTRGTRMGSSPLSFLDFYPGEELRLLASGKKSKRWTVKIGDIKYTVPAKNVVKKRKAQCGLSSCVKLTSQTQYYRSPNEFDKAQPIADGIYVALTATDGWYRVQTNETFVWLRAGQMKAAKVSCDSQMVTEVSEGIKAVSRLEDDDMDGPANLGRYQWRFGFEGGFIQNVSAKPLRNLLSGVPSGSTNVNTDSYDSPIIEETTDGAGWYAGATLEAFLAWRLKAKWSLGYKSRNLDYISRNNPHVPAATITFDELTRDVITEDFGFIYLGTFIKHEGLKALGVLWQPGLNLGVDFALDNYAQEFLTAPNKLNRYSVESGYNSLEIFYGPRLDVTYGVLVLSVMANFTSYDIEPTAGVGLLF